jgi:von Willebrand factor type D domain
MRIYIRLDPSYVNNTRGLCGTYDYNSQNDFLTRISIVETNILTFVDDYRTDSTCVTPSQQHPCQQNVFVCIVKNTRKQHNDYLHLLLERENRAK